MFPMEVAVYQGDGRRIPIHVCDQSGNGIDPSFLAGVQPPVTGDYFVFSGGLRTDNQRCQQTLGQDAPDKLIHFFIIRYFEGMVFKGL